MSSKGILFTQLLVLAVGVWSLTSDELHVRVTARGDTFTVWVDNNRLLGKTSSAYPRGRIGFGLSPKDSAHKAIFTNFLHPQGWRNLEVRDLKTGKVLATDEDVRREVDEGKHPGWYIDRRGYFTTQGRSYLYFGKENWTDYSIDVDFVNGYAGVIDLRVPARGRGLTLAVRPFNYNVALRGLGGIQLKVSPLFVTKQIVFKLFCIYLICCGVVLAALAVAFFAVFIFSLIDLCRIGVILAWPLRLFTRPLVTRWAKRVGLVIIALAGIAFLALSIWIMVGPHEKIPHIQDSIVYLFQAKLNALGHLSMPVPPIIDSLEFQYMVAKYGKWYGKYSPGLPFLLVPGVLAGVPWLVSPILGVLCFFLIVALARRLYSFPEALLTSIMALACPFFLFLSGSFMNHVTCLLGVLFFIYFLIRMEQKGRCGYGFLAGFSLGYAILTRTLSPMAIALPWVVWQGLYLFRRGRRIETLKRFLLMGAGLAIPVGFLLWYNYHLTGDPLLFPFQLARSFDRLGFGRTIGLAGGHSLAKGIRNTESFLMYLLNDLFGWPHYLTLVFIFIPFALCSKNKWDWLLLASWVAVAVAHLFYWARIRNFFGPRYWFEAMPAFIILTVRGIGVSSSACGRLAERIRIILGRPAYVAHWARIAATAALLLFLAWLIKGNVETYFPDQMRRHKTYNGVDARILKMVDKNDIHHAVVFVSKDRAWHWQNYGSVFPSNSPLLDSDVIYVKYLDDYKNGLVMREFPGREFYVADYRGDTISRMSGEQVQRCLEAAGKDMPDQRRTSRAGKEERERKEVLRPMPPPMRASAPGDGLGRYNEPRGIAVGRDGVVYVADFRNYRIQKLDKDGSFIRAWGEKGSGPGQFRDPCDVAVAEGGLVYVADTFNNRVQVFDADGNFVRQFKGGFFAPRGIAVDSKGRVWIVDTANNMVKVFSAGGEPILEIGREGRGSKKVESGAFTRPIGVASDGAGKMYVADSGNRRVQVFDADGAYLSDFAVDGWREGAAVNEPYIAVDASGDIYLTDPPGRRVLRYSSDGTLLGMLEPREGNKPLMRCPAGIALDPAGDGVYVADCRNHTVRKFSKSDFK
jgi:DNA-binding beta-propeller fold protein YncE